MSQDVKTIHNVYNSISVTLIYFTLQLSIHISISCLSVKTAC